LKNQWPAAAVAAFEDLDLGALVEGRDGRDEPLGGIAPDAVREM
jgi:hypothetical protein